MYLKIHIRRWFDVWKKGKKGAEKSHQYSKGSKNLRECPKVQAAWVRGRKREPHITQPGIVL